MAVNNHISEYIRTLDSDGGETLPVVFLAARQSTQARRNPGLPGVERGGWTIQGVGPMPVPRRPPFLGWADGVDGVHCSSSTGYYMLATAETTSRSPSACNAPSSHAHLTIKDKRFPQTKFELLAR